MAVRNLYHVSFPGVYLGGTIVAIASSEKFAKRLALKLIKQDTTNTKSINEAALDVEKLSFITSSSRMIKPRAWMLDNGDY